MDEKEFKSTYSEVNTLPCVFAKAILTRCCQCKRAQRIYIAEREAIGCRSPAAQDECREVLEQFRRKALFALRMTQFEEKLPHGKEVKVECGGMLGLQSALSGPTMPAPENPDIYPLLKRARNVYGCLEAFPYTEIIKHISTYKARKRQRPE